MFEEINYYNRSLNDMNFWYPMVKEWWLPNPETYIIKHDVNLIEIVDWKKPKWIIALVDEIDNYAKKVWYPCFMRFAHSSDKHSWTDTCFLKDKKSIIKNLWHLTEFSYVADMRLAMRTDSVVIRKLLKTDPYFTAFKDMPITKEVRCVISEELKVLRYWPLVAFEWKEVKDELEQMYKMNEEDISFFEQVLPFLRKQLQWNWSVDFLYSEWQWYCIDMAVLEESYINKEDNAVLYKLTR